VREIAAHRPCGPERDRRGITDEIDESITFDGREQMSPATGGKLRERVVTMGGCAARSLPVPLDAEGDALANVRVLDGLGGIDWDAALEMLACRGHAVPKLVQSSRTTRNRSSARGRSSRGLT